MWLQLVTLFYFITLNYLLKPVFPGMSPPSQKAGSTECFFPPEPWFILGHWFFVCDGGPVTVFSWHTINVSISVISARWDETMPQRTQSPCLCSNSYHVSTWLQQLYDGRSSDVSSTAVVHVAAHLAHHTYSTSPPHHAMPSTTPGDAASVWSWL